VGNSQFGAFEWRESILVHLMLKHGFRIVSSFHRHEYFDVLRMLGETDEGLDESSAAVCVVGAVGY
jgi:hypothetical protein